MKHFLNKEELYVPRETNFKNKSLQSFHVEQKKT